MTTTHTITHVHAEAPCGCRLPVPKGRVGWARAVDGDELPEACSHGVAWWQREAFDPYGVEWSDRGLCAALYAALNVPIDPTSLTARTTIAWAMHELLRDAVFVIPGRRAGDVVVRPGDPRPGIDWLLARAQVALEQFETFRPVQATHDAEPTWLVCGTVAGLDARAEVRAERVTITEALEAVVAEAEGMRRRARPQGSGCGPDPWPLDD